MAAIKKKKKIRTYKMIRPKKKNAQINYASPQPQLVKQKHLLQKTNSKIGSDG